MQLRLSKFDTGSAFRSTLSARETIRGACVMPVYTYTTLDDPLASAFTSANGINDIGQIVGSYGDATGGTHGDRT
jgi:hypothetical protein